MNKVDSHQHFWEYNPRKHSWINDEMEDLRQDFLPPDLKRNLDEVDMDGCVAVQADQSLQETIFLLGLAEKYEYVKGVVGWLDIQADDFEQQLEHFASHEALKGLRHIVQDEPDERYLLRPDFLRGIEQLPDHGLTYDILIYARHLPVAIKFASKFPDHRFVLDHIAKPDIADQKIDAWEQDIRELARHPNIYCKVSGMVTEADWKSWTPDDFKPYLDVVFDAFGTKRLMFGSDWPVCTLAAKYREVYKLVSDYTETCTEKEKADFFGENAIRFYGLNNI
ncbi:MAG: amidohydrolase family protein [Balneolaceae bacterium]|nr:amidohydrolase family protein [Balneolaceae bacterium]